MDEEKQAMVEIVKAIEYLIKKNDTGTKIYTGLIESIDSSGYKVVMNGKSYVLPLYGDKTLTVGTTVKICIPQNNMNLAFIM